MTLEAAAGVLRSVEAQVEGLLFEGGFHADDYRQRPWIIVVQDARDPDGERFVTIEPFQDLRFGIDAADQLGWRPHAATLLNMGDVFDGVIDRLAAAGVDLRDAPPEELAPDSIRATLQRESGE